MTRPFARIVADARSVPFEFDPARGVAIGIVDESGPGRGLAARKILECAHAGRPQDPLQFVFDVENAFHTLAEAFPYMIVGGDYAQIPLRMRPDSILEEVLRAGKSAILQIHALPAAERTAFIARFILALLDLPRSSWRPIVVFIDEAHLYAPRGGHAASLEPIVSLLAQGPPRGIGAILATAHPAKLYEGAAERIATWLVGRVGSSRDRGVAAGLVGLAPNGAEARGLARLSADQFWVRGAGISEPATPAPVGGAVLVRVEPTLTKPGAATALAVRAGAGRRPAFGRVASSAVIVGSILLGLLGMVLVLRGGFVLPSLVLMLAGMFGLVVAHIGSTINR
ncbi:ATP-binding protein [Segnochrobactrum spirostomi]|uniref:ATP-binding protein n=1 Tax=Segnochrobactrum spirostomi TaxID=2608987 RepID=A0A6A7Y0B9_9HYPH|nr:ATP-binding protein [Segnochrobactrum spirostomi]MQT11449.1 ATP-binding protein [Segnochrobactrum spirostomi]